ASLEVRQAEVREADRGEEEELDRALDLLVDDAGGRAWRWPAAVVDEDVDPAERADRLLDEPVEVAGDRDVADDGERPEPLGLSLEHRAPPREHRDVRTLRRERLGDCESHARRRPADDRGATAEP